MAVGKDWTSLKIVQNEFDDNGKAQAIQIRAMRTDNDRITFSYAIGLMVQGGAEDGSDQFRAFKYIPDRYLMEYIELLQEACTKVRVAAANIRHNDETGEISVPLLENSISRRRRRTNRITEGSEGDVVGDTDCDEKLDTAESDDTE